MQIRGSVELPGRAQAAWAALTNPAVLQRCIAGCENFIRTTPNAFAAVVRAKVGPLRARIRVDITLQDADPPTSWSLEATAQSPIGAATATTAISLTEHGPGTTLSYTAKATLGGKLALFAGRWSDQATQAALDDFFARLSEVLHENAAGNLPEEMPIDAETIAPLPPPEPAANPRNRATLWIGIGSVAAVTAVVGIAAVWRRR